jgi:hypothetical protein
MILIVLSNSLPMYVIVDEQRSKVCNARCSSFICLHRGYVWAFPNLWKLSDCNDWLNNNVRGETRHWETLRKILGATPSGPLGLELFSISNWSFTSCSVINNSGQILSRAKSSFGRFGSFSIFEISAKYLLKISHFSVCKMMEKIIVKHLHNYVLEHHIITEHQSGFQPKDSTVNQLVYIYNTIFSNLDIGSTLQWLIK